MRDNPSGYVPRPLVTSLLALTESVPSLDTATGASRTPYGMGFSQPFLFLIKFQPCASRASMYAYMVQTTAARSVLCGTTYKNYRPQGRNADMGENALGLTRGPNKNGKWRKKRD